MPDASAYSDYDTYSSMSWSSARKTVPSQPQYYQQPLGHVLIHSPTPNHPGPHHTQSSHAIHHPTMLDLDFTDEWRSYPQSYPRIKQEELVVYPSSASYGSTPSSHSIYDLGSGHAYYEQQHQAAPLLHHSHQHQHQQPHPIQPNYIHPADISPCDSPLSPLQLDYPVPYSSNHSSHHNNQGPQSTISCDPRFVGGDLDLGSSGIDHEYSGGARSEPEYTFKDERDANGEMDSEVTSERAGTDTSSSEERVGSHSQHSSHYATTPDREGSYDEEVDDYDYDDYNDDDSRDGDFTLRRSSSVQLTTPTRSLRQRSSRQSPIERYNPYDYPPSYPDGVPTTRTRRAVSNATASSVSSSSS